MLVDKESANANLHYVLDQTAREIVRLRQEGKRVFLHCVAAAHVLPLCCRLQHAAWHARKRDLPPVVV
ncbi:hypothetical protein [Streptomyces sp. NPDC055287]